MSTVFLCGFMGCGKTTIGKILARNTESFFVDMDNYIEDYEHKSIPEIFEEKGEKYFRELETKAVKNLVNSDYIIATGGGAMVSDENSKKARESGIVIFLDTPFKSCYERIKNDKHRPVAVNSSEEELLTLFNTRRVKYQNNSTMTVDGSGSPNEIAKKICELLYGK